MICPARPPIPEAALLADSAAPVMALPAELVTRERPCCAFPAMLDAPSLAFVAVEEAALVASVVVEAARRCSSHLGCLSDNRTRRPDIV